MANEKNPRRDVTIDKDKDEQREFGDSTDVDEDVMNVGNETEESENKSVDLEH